TICVPANFGSVPIGEPTEFICMPSSAKTAVDVNVNFQVARVSANFRKSNRPHTCCQELPAWIVKPSVTELPALVVTVKLPVQPDRARIWNEQNQRLAGAMAIGVPENCKVAGFVSPVTLREAVP